MEQNRSERNYTFETGIAPNGFLGSETRKKCRLSETARIARSADYGTLAVTLTAIRVAQLAIQDYLRRHN